MLLEKKPHKLTNQIVIKAENIGVSFKTGFQKDDYKSRVFDFLSRKKKLNRHQLFWPLRNINLTGYQGEILGIIGSNGSGKTTLCKLIAGILHPDEGNLYVDGSVSALFSLGMGFNKELTGRENVYVNGMMLGIEKSKINKFIQQIHDFSGIGAFFDRPVKTYSSGMKSRLGFSVASFLEPEILILDEALNTGDAEFSQKAAAKMRELVSRAKMVILVTHSLRYAQSNCDRLIWLDKGVIRAEGNPEEIVEMYRSTVPEKPKSGKSFSIQKTESDIKNRRVMVAKNISVSYQIGKETHWALDNVSFEINEGEIVGIIGKNGAGKSTLCKVLTKIITPDKGSLKLKGETTALLGYGTGFNAQLTGRDNIYLNGMLLGIPKKRVECEYQKIVSFSELERFINKPVKEYSSGMRSRLGFSIAATLQPDIFIIDEALSTGDMAFQQKASEKMQEMIGQAKAVIIVSHSMRFVEKVCTRVIWIDQGKIRFDGEPKEAVTQYKKLTNIEKKKRN
ncbi:ABC transporter ATP-binding protein [Novibacillus thermophilus]|uniref:Teichoic acid ABC transporter ATP-binding protein n=1 Tax=Novibacillus thermophilus TaxID=1471761 RepID=A0A1U9KAP7_9BACL|nr:ATP-binding cassette domain-containing protein [Novibacillus thermophilus]AQS57114.1 teichoic acid ABC transporter ATP-binding protein [Novibacillus thermophilus]